MYIDKVGMLFIIFKKYIYFNLILNIFIYINLLVFLTAGEGGL